MNPLQIFAPSSLNDPTLAPNLGGYGMRFLAEGDSWFTVGALNPLKNANLLFEMRFEQTAVAINCATPGDTLRRMAALRSDPEFVDLLAGRRRRAWDGILMSCGGNDLIDALGVRGAGVPLALRLLREAAEWGPVAEGAARYLSDAGWQTFCTYFEANLDAIVALRDRGPSKGAPIFLHGYAVPMPRPAPAGMGLGPWLLPAVQAYGIPVDDYEAVAELLIGRLAKLLSDCAADAARFPNLHFFDTTLIPVEPAAPGSSGESGDWINEIHLNRSGCRKLAVPWAKAIEAVIVGQRG
ncbi:hypothetical protein FSC37_21025 [Piscinibacter aquaticus]|uniref:SGNH/GDSL hydrolase family protein n=1 Tax=Piscinibacter aquaticus TaxID=392597 RepID=A0A5C6U3Q6_9BURK|nr:hypothetical protein FSC37_21025 [Piscinibacter aquaticus]